MTETQLKEIRTHLMQGLNNVTGHSSIDIPVVENCPDDTDFAAQLAQHGLNVAMQRRRVARIRELETALKRLTETDYGMCEECGDHIGVARLKANPSARLCVHCQSEAEDGLTRRCA
ncbi:MULTISPECIES: TraR/DksA family transcriptional regulator [unclassified Pseudodesulfovibrio]|uniref:TraR/DksA family transcriptional regulator n=1 Tax=unclassified Pseudodesulfovibrio TaxID=2661612 RepID=UPI000FEBD3E8|nr:MULTISPECIES: TraR/DksA family transcriptional regulator [unclassified Pseudodesulfovibrio]MCJ2166190.1 TraR/DksA family transcriptional regulator [Pseudodesulfovibrio sp. S3-i]RWU02327.1 TraR/DksA family transcriptional regulator [Pseudodesulfovibrio sp. S3]